MGRGQTATFLLKGADCRRVVAVRKQPDSGVSVAFHFTPLRNRSRPMPGC